MKKTTYSVIIICGFILLMIPFIFSNKEKNEFHNSYTVKRKDLNLKLFLRGELRASKFVKIKSEIMSNRAKIIELIPEGTKVRKGELIARFDVKPFTDEYSMWKQKLRECQNRITSYEKEIEKLKAKEEKEKKKLKYSLDLEKIKLKDIKEGSGLLKLKELENEIKKKEREVEIKKGQLEDFKSLFKNGYISKRELQKAQDELNNALEALRIAKERLDNYKNFEWKMKIRECELSLERSKELMASQLKQIEINIKKLTQQLNIAKQNLEFYKNKVESSERDILKCEIYAPIDGVVLYNEIPVNGKRRKVEVGDSIWYGQTFMQIPDTSNMIVIARVKEYDLKYVYKGQKVIIIPDAYNNMKFAGKIDYIANVADSSSSDEPVKMFKIIIKVDNPDTKILRSGMSATIEVNCNTIKNALVIPVEAIILKNNKSYVRIKNKSKFVLKEIKVGQVSGEEAQILSGLKEGDVIYY